MGFVMTKVTRQNAMTAAVTLKSSFGVLESGLACSRSHGGVFCLFRLRDLSEWERVRANVRLKSSPDPIIILLVKQIYNESSVRSYEVLHRGVFLRYSTHNGSPATGYVTMP